jgi:hypothetical protein
MLDLNHPMSDHVFAAARAMGAVIYAARAMTVAARHRRVRLRDSCASAFEELRRLSRDHFADRRAIPAAIDDLERALSELAGLPGVPYDGQPAKYKCPACGEDLERWKIMDRVSCPHRPPEIHCGLCLMITSPPLIILQAMGEGFGTEAI